MRSAPKDLLPPRPVDPLFILQGFVSRCLSAAPSASRRPKKMTSSKIHWSTVPPMRRIGIWLNTSPLKLIPKERAKVFLRIRASRQNPYPGPSNNNRYRAIETIDRASVLTKSRLSSIDVRGAYFFYEIGVLTSSQPLVGSVPENCRESTGQYEIYTQSFFIPRINERAGCIPKTSQT